MLCCSYCVLLLCWVVNSVVLIVKCVVFCCVVLVCNCVLLCIFVCKCVVYYRGAGKSLARPGRKQATATEDFEFHPSNVLS